MAHLQQDGAPPAAAHGEWDGMSVRRPLLPGGGEGIPRGDAAAHRRDREPGDEHRHRRRRSESRIELRGHRPRWYGPRARARCDVPARRGEASWTRLTRDAAATTRLAGAAPGWVRKAPAGSPGPADAAWRR